MSLTSSNSTDDPNKCYGVDRGGALLDAVALLVGLCGGVRDNPLRVIGGALPIQGVPAVHSLADWAHIPHGGALGVVSRGNVRINTKNL